MGEWNTAGYLRLSREDGDKAESDSIANQRKLLEQYIETHPELHLVDFYQDDGYTGTNFDRPSFRKMEADIEAGKVNCVLVKDLSRFGREYAQMGLYIEHYFEEKESVLSRWQKTLTPKMAQIIWSCPLPMSSIPSMPAKLPPKPKPLIVPEPKPECIWVPGRPSGISKIPMTGIT